MIKSACQYLALFLCAVGSASVQAEPPATQQVAAPKATRVRKAGGERGPKVEMTHVSQPSAGAASAARVAAWRALRRGLKTPGELPPAFRDELRVHARRMARLQRVRLLAV
jgi:hypothetical protein